MAIELHRNLGRALLLATLGTIVLTAITFLAAACLALGKSPANVGEDLFFGASAGAIAALPIAILTSCSKDNYRLAVAFVAALTWALMTSAYYNYLVYAIANC